MGLKYYVVSEGDTQKEEKDNADYIGREVWILGEIIEVANDFPGGILVQIEHEDGDGEPLSTDLNFAAESEYLKFKSTKEDQEGILIDD